MGQVPKRIILPQRESRRLFVVKGGENSQIEDVFLVKSLPLGLLLRALFVHFGFRHPGLIQDVLNSQISSTKGLIEAVVRFSLSLRFSALPPPPPSQRSGRPLPPSLRGRGRGGSYLLPRSGRAGSPTFRPTFEKTPPEREVLSWNSKFLGESRRPGDSFLCPAQTIYGSPRQVGRWVGSPPVPTPLLRKLLTCFAQPRNVSLSSTNRT